MCQDLQNEENEIFHEESAEVVISLTFCFSWNSAKLNATCEGKKP